MRSTILNTGIGKLDQVSPRTSYSSHGIPYAQSAQLGVGVLVADAPFERAHGLLGRDRLGSDDIGDFEVQRNILTGHQVSQRGGNNKAQAGLGCAYRLLLVAFSICSSKAVLAEDDHQLIILGATAATAVGVAERREGVWTLG